ncbi:MAG: NfeD family protein [Opitutaceae bacterium]|nr:NfeD family protein [Opitutaceae bacterium]
MTAILLLFLLGTVLLVFEVFMPGSILGILGGVAMLGGCVVAFVDYGAGGGSLAVLAGLAILGLALYAEFGLLPRTRLGKRFFLHDSIGATSQPPLAEAGAVVGKLCEAATTLAPTGYVLLDGRRYEAFSQSGHVARGTTLQVVAVDNFRLTVTKP